MSRETVKITAEPGSLHLAWSSFGGQLELKLLITLLVASPVIGALVLGFSQLGELGVAGAAVCFGGVALLGAVIWLLVSGSVEVLLDARGLTRTVRRPLWLVSGDTTPGPIVLHIAPLCGTSSVPEGTPAQFMAVFSPVDAAFAPIENILLTASDVARLKEALARADVPGLTLRQDVKIEDESRPDCRVCGYDLVGSAAAAKCPECGEPIDAGHRRTLARLHAMRRSRS